MSIHAKLLPTNRALKSEDYHYPASFKLDTTAPANKTEMSMSEILMLIILAVVIIFGGYLLSYRSGQHRALREKRDDNLPSKEE